MIGPGRAASQGTATNISPISRLPEPEALNVFVIVAHGGIAIRRLLKMEVDQLLQVRAHDLVRVEKDDLVEVHREENVKKENLVCPDDPLLFALLA